MARDVGNPNIEIRLTKSKNKKGEQHICTCDRIRSGKVGSWMVLW